jgi:regulator of sigma E protease
MSFLFTLVVFIAGLTLLVVVHELGHFLPAKLFGMRVEKFYIFFDWPRKLWSVTRGGTEFGIGVLPLGGYVKIGGMIDESMDDEAIRQEKAGIPPQPDEFRAKPVWQRMIVMVGGVTFNVILAIIIFSSIALITGDARIRLDALPNGLYVPEKSVGAELGLQSGDRLVALNGQPATYLPGGRELQRLLLSDSATVTVQRGEERITLSVPSNYLDRLGGADKPEMTLGEIDPEPIIVLGDSNGPGAKAGLRNGDRILQIGTTRTPSFQAMREALAGHAEKSVAITALRGTDTLRLTAVPDSAGKLMIGADPSRIKIEQVRYGFFESWAVGTGMAFGAVGDQLSGFRKIFAGEVSANKAVAGPVKIAQFMGDATRAGGVLGWLYIVGLLSMILAVVNILPIPALDGGHLVFLLIELVMRREPSLKVRLVAQQIGMFLLFGLMIFVLFNDAIRAIWS